MVRTGRFAIIVLSLVTASIFSGCKRPHAGSDPQLEQNKTLVQRWFDVGFNKRTLAVVDEVFADTVIVNGTVIPRAGLKQSMSRHFAGFPDLHVTIDAVVGEGSRVGIWYTAAGTHQGTFDRFPPTGKHVTWTGVDLLTFHQGKVSEAVFVSELPTQLGVTVK
jgi:steroid delta-isomerase-like uncharacterized protein